MTQRVQFFILDVSSRIKNQEAKLPEYYNSSRIKQRPKVQLYLIFLSYTCAGNFEIISSDGHFTSFEEKAKQLFAVSLYCIFPIF